MSQPDQLSKLVSPNIIVAALFIRVSSVLVIDCLSREEPASFALFYKASAMEMEQ